MATERARQVSTALTKTWPSLPVEYELYLTRVPAFVRYGGVSYAACVAAQAVQEVAQGLLVH